MNMPAGAGKKPSKARKGSANKPCKNLLPSTSRVKQSSAAALYAHVQQSSCSVTLVPSSFHDQPPQGVLLGHPNSTTNVPSYNPLSHMSMMPSLVLSPHHPALADPFSPSLLNSPMHGQHRISLILPKRPQPALGMYVVSLLRFCNPRVAVCYGCRQTLKPCSTIPSPPDDMVIVSNQFRTYFKDAKEHTSSKPTLVYFHSSLPCIHVFMHNVHLVSSLMTVPSDVMPHLLEQHKKTLRNMFFSPI